MAALTITSTTVKDGGGASVTAGTCTDGTRTMPATGVLGADGAAFQPAMDVAARCGFFSLVVGGAAVAYGQQAMAASIPVVVASNQSSIPVAATLQAGSAIAGKVGVDQTTPGTTNAVVSDLKSGVIYDDAGNKLTVKYAKIAASSSGDNTLVAAVTSKKIRVLAYNLMGNGAVNAKFQSGAAGTDLTGLKYIAAAGGGLCAPYSKDGWFETAANTLLNLNLSGAVAVGGELVYVEVL